MKLNALTLTAVAVAGLAVFQFARKWRQDHPQHSPDVAESYAREVYGQAAGQRQASGAAVPMNTDYLRYWASPLADTIYGNGSLGD